MNAYYNEHDAFAAEWLRGLIREGLIAPGHVDQRDIQEIQPGDLAGFTQCHFFAGIGGWSLALRLAGWPDSRPVWTGSCPCQPYSSAGKGEGADDARNLWPAWFRLVRECRPGVVFGEQVEAAVRHGWLDAVSTDLEAEGYAFGAVVLGAHSVDAPHIRQRLFFVADAERGPAERSGLNVGEAPGRPEGATQERKRLRPNPWNGESVEWLPCRDGKARPTKPGLFPLAHGVPNRVGTLRGAGNAIVPQAAAEVIGAYMSTKAAPPEVK